MQEYLRRLLKDKARLRKWKRIMIALSCIVVVCTVYALSLPAQTMTCDKEEHTHTAECYDENNELICEKEEHTHNEDCNKQEEVNEQEEVVKDEPETINNEQVSQESEEETTTTTTSETTKQPFDLSSEANKDKITSVVMYYKDENGTWNNLEDGNANPSSTELYLKVEFDKINTKELLEQHNGILVYSLPDFMRDFEKAGNGNLLAGERNIGTIEIENNQGIVTFKLVGNGFRRYMVRHLVGGLIQVGAHRITKEFLEELLESKGQKKCLFKAKPQGLYLHEVFYK